MKKTQVQKIKIFFGTLARGPNTTFGALTQFEKKLFFFFAREIEFSRWLSKMQFFRSEFWSDLGVKNWIEILIVILLTFFFGYLFYLSF